MRLGLALGLVVLAAAPADARKVCFSGPLRPQVVGGETKRLSGSGGVIVGSGSEFPMWKFRNLNTLVAPHVVQLAPGLAIYHPPPLADTTVVIENELHAVMSTSKRVFQIEPVPPGPEVTAVTKAGTSNRGIVVVEMSTKPPEIAAVAIISRVTRGGVTPLAWVDLRFTTRDRLFQIWHPRGSCEEKIPDEIEPVLGDRVVISWVDETGRVSEPSKPLVITAGSNGK